MNTALSDILLILLVSIGTGMIFYSIITLTDPKH